MQTHCCPDPELPCRRGVGGGKLFPVSSTLQLVLGRLLLLGVVLAGFAEAIVPTLASSKLDPELKGLVLIEELNCVACHAGNASLGTRSKKAPQLTEVCSRVNPSYLRLSSASRTGPNRARRCRT